MHRNGLLRQTGRLSLSELGLLLLLMLVCGSIGCSPDPRHVTNQQPLRRFGESEFRITRHDGSTYPFRFSPDGKLIACANWYEFK
ncbi:MAG TPA: hypothetical protein VGI75_15240, partial [Pirellulales bacterium]